MAEGTVAKRALTVVALEEIATLTRAPPVDQVVVVVADEAEAATEGESIRGF